jgi:hypothetical protein
MRRFRSTESSSYRAEGLPRSCNRDRKGCLVGATFPKIAAAAHFIKSLPLVLTSISRDFPPAVAKVYIVSFRTHDDGRPSKFIVIKMAWEHGEVDFQSRFDKSTGQAEEMKGATRSVKRQGNFQTVIRLDLAEIQASIRSISD